MHYTLLVYTANRRSGRVSMCWMNSVGKLSVSLPANAALTSGH